MALPSGGKILARLPDRAFVDVCRAALELGREELGEACGRDADLAHVAGAVVTYCWARPMLSLEPRGPDAMHPDAMAEEDALFILKWGMERGRVIVTEQDGQVMVSERPRRGAKVRTKRNRKVR